MMWIISNTRVNDSAKSLEKFIGNIIENQASGLILGFFIKEILPEARIAFA